jgi:hypothetical protein
MLIESAPPWSAFHTKVFGKPLETETAFTALALFNMLR